MFGNNEEPQGKRLIHAPLYAVSMPNFCRVLTSESDPAYADPVTWKQKGTTDNQKVDYINTAKCIAYRQNFAVTATGFTDPQFQPSSSPSDEYEIMRQLTYRGDT